MNEEKLLQRLLLAYQTAETRLTGIVASYVLLGIEDEMLDSTWAAMKLAQVRSLAADTTRVLNELAQSDDTARQLLLNQYLSGLQELPVGMIGTNVEAMNKLAADYLGLLKTSRVQILRKTVDAYRSIVADVVAQSALGVDTRLETARKALKNFADKGISAFVDSQGRQWQIASYAEMATRTATNNALREGRLEGLANNGRDLIIVSSVPNPSDLCAPYERKVLSITGKTSGYTPLQEAKEQGLFHPNCRHSFTRYVPGETIIGDTDAQKGYDDYEGMQRQREIERNIRRWKRRIEVSDTAEAKTKAQNKVKEWRAILKEHLDTHDSLVEKPNGLSNKAAR